MSPQRIQLSRQRGWRKPDGAIIVSRPSHWGNPYPVAKWGRAQAVMLYGFDLAHHVLGSAIYDRIREELGGHDLACWCPLDQPCHADVLLSIANPEAS